MRLGLVIPPLNVVCAGTLNSSFSALLLEYDAVAAICAGLPASRSSGQLFSVVHIKGLAIPFHPHTLLDHIPT